MTLLKIKKSKLNSQATRCSFLFGPLSCAVRNGQWGESWLFCKYPGMLAVPGSVWRIPRKAFPKPNTQRHLNVHSEIDT
jgi:hypothetical protein